MMPGFRAETRGSWVELATRPQRLLAAAITAGVAAATDGMKLDMRQAMERAGLGRRLPNALRSQVWPKGRDSMRAAGTVYPAGARAALLISLFQDGGEVRGRQGQFIAIPTKAAGAAVWRAGRYQLTPNDWQARTGITLRLIKPRGMRASGLLVAPEGVLAKRGFQVKRATKRRLAAGRAVVRNIAIFVLVPRVLVAGRYDLEAIARRWSERVPDLIERAMPDSAED